MAISPTSGSIGFTRPLLHVLRENWWLFLLRGLCAILFGALAFAWPGVTLATLILLYGVYAVLDGILAIIAAITGGVAGSRWWLAVVGMLGIATGGLTFIWPSVSAFVLLIFIAAWAITTGIMQIVGAIQLRKEIEDEWLLTVSGLLSVAFGFLLLWQPGSGALALIFVIGAYAILYGILLVSFGLWLRRRT